MREAGRAMDPDLMASATTGHELTSGQ
jgi:hypothetical protein